MTLEAPRAVIYPPKTVKASALGRRGFSAVLASAVMLMAGPAPARAEFLVSLDYQADPVLPGCPAVTDFRKEIARQLGHDPFGENAPRRLLVRLYAIGARMGGRVEWRDASDQWEGERSFSSRNESCAEMAHAIALATAIQIQLLASLDEGLPPRPEADSKPPALAIGGSKPDLGSPAQVTSNGGPPPGASPREPRMAVDVGVGVIQDFGDGPAFVVPRIAVSVGRPSVIGVRLAASGLGPGTQITRSEGVAQVDRLVMTLAREGVGRPRPNRRSAPRRCCLPGPIPAQRAPAGGQSHAALGAVIEDWARAGRLRAGSRRGRERRPGLAVRPRARRRRLGRHRHARAASRAARSLRS
jgi:hypothetical protein